MLERFGSSRLESQFLASLGTGDFQPVDLTINDYARMSELVTRYDDLPLGTTTHR